MATGRIGTTPVLTTRWSKAPAAGTTSLSGSDDNSVSLVYSVGYEAVYQNGVLLSRGNDYTATNGTTITLTTATVAGDIIEVFANQTIPLTDTYTQTVSDGRFIKNTLTTTTGDIIYASAANTPARLAIGSTNQVLTVSGGVPAWAAAQSPTFVGCALKASADQTISNTTYTAITWNQEDFDTDAFHDNTTNNSRITIPSGKAGKYLISGFVTWDTDSNGTRELWIYKNGTQLKQVRYGATSKLNTEQITCVLDLVATDYVQLYVYQDSGTTRTMYGSNTQGQFSAALLGA